MERDSNNWGIVTKDMIGKKFIGTRTRDSFPFVEIPEMEVLALTEDGTRVKIRFHTGLFADKENWFRIEEIGIGDFICDKAPSDKPEVFPFKSRRIVKRR